MCGANCHHMCVTENKILAPFVHGRFCFDCALHVGLVTKAVPGGLVGAKGLFGSYYAKGSTCRACRSQRRSHSAAC